MAKWFSTRIRAARERAGLSQTDLGELVGVTGATICNWENRTSEPRGDPYERIVTWLEKTERSVEPDAFNGSDGLEDDGSVGPSAVGEWLNKARVTKGLTVAELAKRAGVSVPAIYFIESGQSQNPRRETLDKLQRALGGTEIDPAARKAIQEEATIEGLGVLTDFDPYDPDNLPNGPGVYVFYDVSQRPIYVGMSHDVRGRILQHNEKFWFKAPIVETGAYIEIKDKTLRKQIETLLIKFLKSNAVLNKQNVERR